MSKYIIFGSGDVGTKVLNKLLQENHEILYFCDNNPKKWGTLFHSFSVMCPDSIKNTSYDYIAIAVYKAVFLIQEQLLRLGVDKSKIVVPLSPPRIDPLPNNNNFDLNILPKEEYYSKSTIEYSNLNIQIKDDTFLKNLKHLKQVLEQYNIPRKDVCVVSGAVLQAYGLRTSELFDDIDIIMTSNLRDIYGYGLVIVSEAVEMHPINEYAICDDDIINNMNYHFIFNDLKFLNLDIEMQKRNHLYRPLNVSSK